MGSTVFGEVGFEELLRQLLFVGLKRERASNPCDLLRSPQPNHGTLPSAEVVESISFPGRIPFHPKRSHLPRSDSTHVAVIGEVKGGPWIAKAIRRLWNPDDR